ncbi:hypothetical protein E2C01_050066 [Portunus trituberculatus]|uniref:Uncharacterized protein n=1 Tax=Portunus trituberculatus TaxID=210409 RepID=A0A5B7GB29_PORTR|nr:hypothetical protein [Portunus trituberculatus]
MFGESSAVQLSRGEARRGRRRRKRRRRCIRGVKEEWKGRRRGGGLGSRPVGVLDGEGHRYERVKGSGAGMLRAGVSFENGRDAGEVFQNTECGCTAWLGGSAGRNRWAAGK